MKFNLLKINQRSSRGKRTSKEIASLAGKVMQQSSSKLTRKQFRTRVRLLRSLRRLAASALSQRGQ